MAINSGHTIIMADDDEEDCFLATEAFRESGGRAVFSCVKDGIELMDYLSLCLNSESHPLPKFILLDLNMPRKDGRQALLEIKSDDTLKQIPVVVLTTSEEPKDKQFSMKAGASSFLTKPAFFDDWVKIMKSLAEQWL